MRIIKNYVIAFSLILFLCVGCASQVPNPETTVQKFWAAYKSENLEEAAKYVSNELDPETVHDAFWPDEEEFFTDEIQKNFFNRIELTVIDHEIENNAAVVKAEISWPNMELLLGKFMVKAMEVALPAAFGGASDEEMNLLLKPIFLEVLEETPDIQTSHEIDLILVDNTWKINSSPIPDPEEVFDLSAFDEQEELEKGFVEDIDPDRMGYSRTNPAPPGTTLEIHIEDIFESYSAEVTLLELVRGDMAWQAVKEANQFNDPPKEALEYLLARIHFKLTRMGDPEEKFNLSSFHFSAVSREGRDYDLPWIVEPEPSIQAGLYEGANHEGWVVFEVGIEDEPLISYGRDYSGKGGIWWSTISENVSVKLSPPCLSLIIIR